MADLNTEIAERQHREAMFGKFNDFPPNMTEITALEFGQRMTNYNFDHSEFRQMWEDVYTAPAISATLFFFWDDTGVLVTEHGKLYSFGCRHEMIDIPWDKETMGPHYNCTHAHKCSKCGFIKVTDSSD